MPDSDDQFQQSKRQNIYKVEPEMSYAESVSTELEAPSRSKKSLAKKKVVHGHSHHAGIQKVLSEGVQF